MSEHYRNIMKQIELSDEARENFKKNLYLEKNTRFRKNYTLRGALIAACICIFAIAAVIGVSAANEPIDVSIVNEVSSVSESSFDVSAILEPRTEDFSKELLADIEAGKVEKAFYSKDELEEYLGFSIISSPALEAAGINENLARDFEYNVNVPPELKIDINARYIVTGTMLDGSAVTGNPEVIKITAHRIMRNAEVYITAQFLTDYADAEGSEPILAGESFLPYEMIDHEFIINPEDPSDYEVISTRYKTAAKSFTEKKYEMKNGNEATALTVRDIEKDNLMGFRQYRGYFVEDNILYSINPYAIYDPSRSFPMYDYDMLVVLKDVLDSFE